MKQRPASSKRKRPSSSPRVAVSILLSEAVSAHRAGRIREAAELYDRIIAHEPAHGDALHLSGLIAHGEGDHEKALARIDAAISAHSKMSAFHVSRAAVLLALGRNQEAVTSAERAVCLNSCSAEALNLLGNALQSTGRYEEAIREYRHAVALRADYAEASSNLGSALRKTGALGDAEAALRQALRSRPRYATALANLGLVLQEQGRYEEALGTFDAALNVEPDHPAARGNRAILLLLLGRLREGFADYEWRWRLPGFATPARRFDAPPWDGKNADGRTLFIHAEQGLGSAIQFVRYVPLLTERGARVILECHPPLLRLFQQSLAEPSKGRVQIIARGETPPPFEAHAPLMSLPHLFGTTLETIPAAVPYLQADVVNVAQWRQRFASKPGAAIGLVWAGNPQHENDANRSLPPTLLSPLFSLRECTFYSLQVPASVEAMAGFPPGAVIDLAPDLTDFAETAAAVEALDLVITVDTAAAHLAGALARPVWTLLPFVPEWRWLRDRNDSPWYPGMRLFRQATHGDWQELLDRVTAAVADSLQSGRIGS